MEWKLLTYQEWLNLPGGSLIKIKATPTEQLENLSVFMALRKSTPDENLLYYANGEVQTYKMWNLARNIQYPLGWGKGSWEWYIAQ